MGIQGLLPLVREAIKISHISHFTGKKAAVDGFVWLHRGCISCAKELAKGEKTTKYITYFMQQVQLLINHGLRPLIVFDGCDLPAKRVTNEKRRADRADHIKAAIQCDEHGMISEANDHYIKSVEITPDVLYPLFNRLRRQNVEFIVAPYEADAQLAYLAYNKIVDLVITDDSDLIVYQCPLTLFKLDRDGNCQSLLREDLNKIPDLAALSQKMLIESCVLAGCDYLPSIPRMGIRTAIKRMISYRTGEAVIAGLRAEAKWEIPEDYEERYKDACAIFTQQRVFDPRTKKACGIFEECKLDIAGPFLSNEEAINIAYGRMNPKTKELFDPDSSFDPEEAIKVCTANYHTPVTSSAAAKFKPHFPSSAIPPRAPFSLRKPSHSLEFVKVTPPVNIPPALRRRISGKNSYEKPILPKK
ncbi:XPG N-terminal domain containing protein [Tritrichomonas foetus]|uniref:XPG N-terminal domain containing protein n=1 Tax=Tritrichomonas foetus TaxID=1144522 RepID=A0A1J4KYW3_9EUKA|nr:XPG N-terminal domain containing protein [Tritrichomonas foetus]|eukprot:OHT16064.1 XPG N-terminal domain containing protein [Tritrichomonas foetus]